MVCASAAVIRLRLPKIVLPQPIVWARATANSPPAIKASSKPRAIRRRAMLISTQQSLQIGGGIAAPVSGGTEGTWLSCSIISQPCMPRQRSLPKGRVEAATPEDGNAEQELRCGEQQHDQHQSTDNEYDD